ncbi:MAG TPA: hypothetical protein VNI57_04590, partial [Candidatus Saccharimonadales bacterium]|nr:hypothetical protein [Candidatus Saccharimonadales bacterium]
MAGLLAVALLAAGCARAVVYRSYSDLPADRRAAGVTFLAVEEGDWTIDAHAVLAGRLPERTRRVASDDGVEIVSGFGRGAGREVRSAINDLLGETGHGPLSRRDFARALSRRQLTCHAGYVAKGAGSAAEFAGIGGTRCVDALLFRIAAAPAGPLLPHIGLLGDGKVEASGMTRERAALERLSSVPVPVREVTWEEILPWLTAAVRSERRIGPAGEDVAGISICVRNLELLGQGRSADPLGRAVVHALVRFERAGGLPLLLRHSGEPDFPRGVFEQEGIRDMLAPHLAAEGLIFAAAAGPHGP